MIILLLSTLNTGFREIPMPSSGDREFLYSGVVVGEEPYPHFAKLSLSIDRLKTSEGTIDCLIPVEFYARISETYLGRRITIQGKLKPANYAHRSHILSGKLVDVDNAAIGFWDLIYQVRSYIEHSFNNHLDVPLSALGTGLVLGGSSRLPREVKEVFARAGILHVLAVSGLHVGYVCVFAGFALFFVPISRKLKFLFLMMILVMYVAITGFRPSVCRASLMAFLFGLSIVLQRHVNSIHVLNITAICLLIFDPLLLFNVGAQLSFVAVYGIMFLFPKFDEHILQKVKPKVFKIPLILMAVSFSAQVFVAPLLVYYFHRLPVLGIISNVLIVPLASIVIIFLYIFLFTALVSIPSAHILSFLITGLLKLLVGIANFFAHIPGAVVTLSVSPIILLGSYGLFVRRTRKLSVFFLLVVLILMSAGSMLPCSVVRVSREKILITTKTNKKIFITSQRSSGESARFLARYEVDRIDYLIAPDNKCYDMHEYIGLPDDLHEKKVILGDLEIHISNNTCITHGLTRINVERVAASMPESIHYVLTDGKRSFHFTGPLHGSIIDQVVTDFKMVYARAYLFFWIIMYEG